MKVPHVHKKTLYKEINRLLNKDVLQKQNGPHQGPHQGRSAPSFLIPKLIGKARLLVAVR